MCPTSEEIELSSDQDQPAVNGCPEIRGRYVLLHVGKKFASRRLYDGIRKLLRGVSPNGEERVELVNILAQLELHRKRKLDELS